MRTHAEAAFATIGAILISERADDFVGLVGHRKGAGQGRSRWHDLRHVSRIDRWNGKRGAAAKAAKAAHRMRDSVICKGWCANM